jgi:hypothetical protein
MFDYEDMCLLNPVDTRPVFLLKAAKIQRLAPPSVNVGR